jgi:hypothetical protein
MKINQYLPLFLISFFLFAGIVLAKKPLSLVRRDDPRDTMRTFLSAMNDYKKGIEEKIND